MRTFKAQLVLALGAATALLLSMGALSYRRILQEDADQQWVQHTHLVLERLDAVLVDLIDQEPIQHPQAFPGVSGPLSHLSLTRIGEDIAELHRLTSEDLKQQQAFYRLNSLISARLALPSRMAAKGALVGQDEIRGREVMGQIRALVRDIRNEEQGLLAQRLESAAKSSRRAKRLLAAGTILALFLVLLAGLVVHNEIRKRTRTEIELRSAEQRYHLLFDGNPIPSWVYDTKSLAFLDVNPEATAHYGYSRQEFLNLKITDIRPLEDLPALLQSIKDNSSGLQTSGPWGHRTKSGETIEVEIKSYPLTYLGKEARLVVALDVTERKRAEEELRIRNAQLDAANKELEAFSYSVSHDLRAPLRSIDGFSQALSEDCADKLDDVGKSHLQRIRAGTQRMGVLIDDMLNLARVARANMRREKINFSALARSITAELQRMQPDRQVDFRVEDGLEAMGDPHLLRLVWENLIGNAWKFTSKSTSARIEIGRTNANGSRAYFIRDNGAGFDPIYAGKLFGAFQRLHGTAEFPGTGVGLATVQRIIHRHGGRIWAEGAVDKGASFYFTL